MGEDSLPGEVKGKILLLSKQLSWKFNKMKIALSRSISLEASRNRRDRWAEWKARAPEDKLIVVLC